jgi:hypothetical protein
VVLDAVAAEDVDRAVVEADGQGDGHGAFGEFESIPVVLRDLQAVGDDIELLAGHVEGGVLVNFHGAKLAGPALEVKRERVFPALWIKGSGGAFQPDARFKGEPLGTILPQLRKTSGQRKKKECYVKLDNSSVGDRDHCGGFGFRRNCGDGGGPGEDFVLRIFGAVRSVAAVWASQRLSLIPGLRGLASEPNGLGVNSV